MILNFKYNKKCLKIIDQKSRDIFIRFDSIISRSLSSREGETRDSSHKYEMMSNLVRIKKVS